MCMSSPSTPAPPPPPDLPETPKTTDPAVKNARANERQRAALAAGRDSTILTGPTGAGTAATIGKKTLLGQ